MKLLRISIPFLLFILFTSTINAQVGIGTATLDGSAILEISSTTQGFLLPKMTETERDAISDPATGLMIFQTDNSPGFYFNSGTSGSPTWTTVSSSNSLSTAVKTITSDYTITADDSTIICNNGSDNGADVTLPLASSNEDRILTIKNIRASKQYVLPQGSEMIDNYGKVGNNPYEIQEWNYLNIQSDGSNWIIIGENI